MLLGKGSILYCIKIAHICVYQTFSHIIYNLHDCINSCLLAKFCLFVDCWLSKPRLFIYGALLMFWHWTESPNTILSLNHVEDFITRKDSYWRTGMYWDKISTLNATVKFSHILKSLPIQTCFLMATFWMFCLFKPAFQCLCVALFGWTPL